MVSCVSVCANIGYTEAMNGYSGYTGSGTCDNLNRDNGRWHRSRRYCVACMMEAPEQPVKTTLSYLVTNTLSGVGYRNRVTMVKGRCVIHWATRTPDLQFIYIDYSVKIEHSEGTLSHKNVHFFILHCQWSLDIALNRLWYMYNGMQPIVS